MKMKHISKQSLENKARYAANKAGLIAKKSRRHDPLNNEGGFQLTDSHNILVAGSCFNLSSEAVIQYCRS